MDADMDFGDDLDAADLADLDELEANYHATKAQHHLDGSQVAPNAAASSRYDSAASTNRNPLQELDDNSQRSEKPNSRAFWNCAQCTLQNTGDAQVCSACGHSSSNQLAVKATRHKISQRPLEYFHAYSRNQPSIPTSPSGCEQLTPPELDSCGLVRCSSTTPGICIDPNTATTYIYPDQVSRREYQFEIAHTALYSNTMVVLPTGLGKTLIAAVVMFNFYRWFPKGKVLFLAPTRPLVEQQAEACHEKMGLPYDETATIMGNTKKDDDGKRSSLWSSKRVFYATPQTVMNDLRSGACPAESIVCLVVDEAHRATGNFAYVEIVKFLSARDIKFRILALSATPGSDGVKITEVLKNLNIAKMEFRSEEDADVRKYIFGRTTEVVNVMPTEQLQEIQFMWLGSLEAKAEKLFRMGVLKCVYPKYVQERFNYVTARNEFTSAPPPNLPQRRYPEVHRLLTHCQTLANGYSQMQAYSLKQALEYMDSMEGKNTCGLFQDFHVLELMKMMRHVCRRGINHAPKLDALNRIVQDYFQQNPEDSKIIIFTTYRESVKDIVECLSQHPGGLVKAQCFVGQGLSKTAQDKDAGKGQNQKEQARVLESFKRGEINTIVATSVGEEGLDIAQVDLIVIFDAMASPTRMVQRMGRTGRARNGRVVVLAMAGKELQDYEKNLEKTRGIHRALRTGGFPLHPSRSPRMVPRRYTPVVELRTIVVTPRPAARPSKRGLHGAAVGSAWDDPLTVDEEELLARYAPKGDACWKPSLASYSHLQHFPTRISQVKHSERACAFIHTMHLLAGDESADGAGVGEGAGADDDSDTDDLFAGARTLGMPTLQFSPRLDRAPRRTSQWHLTAEAPREAPDCPVPLSSWEAPGSSPAAHPTQAHAMHAPGSLAARVRQLAMGPRQAAGQEPLLPPARSPTSPPRALPSPQIPQSPSSHAPPAQSPPYCAPPAPRSSVPSNLSPPARAPKRLPRHSPPTRPSTSRAGHSQEQVEAAGDDHVPLSAEAGFDEERALEEGLPSPKLQPQQYEGRGTEPLLKTTERPAPGTGAAAREDLPAAITEPPPPPPSHPSFTHRRLFPAVSSHLFQISASGTITVHPRPDFPDPPPIPSAAQELPDAGLSNPLTPPHIVPGASSPDAVHPAAPPHSSFLDTSPLAASPLDVPSLASPTDALPVDARPPRTPRDTIPATPHGASLRHPSRASHLSPHLSHPQPSPHPSYPAPVSTSDRRMECARSPLPLPEHQLQEDTVGAGGGGQVDAGPCCSVQGAGASKRVAPHLTESPMWRPTPPTATIASSRSPLLPSRNTIPGTPSPSPPSTSGGGSPVNDGLPVDDSPMAAPPPEAAEPFVWSPAALSDAKHTCAIPTDDGGAGGRSDICPLPAEASDPVALRHDGARGDGTLLRESSRGSGPAGSTSQHPAGAHEPPSPRGALHRRGDFGNAGERQHPPSQGAQGATDGLAPRVTPAGCGSSLRCDPRHSGGSRAAPPPGPSKMGSAGPCEAASGTPHALEGRASIQLAPPVSMAADEVATGTSAGPGSAADLGQASALGAIRRDSHGVDCGAWRGEERVLEEPHAAAGLGAREPGAGDLSSYDVVDLVEAEAVADDWWSSPVHGEEGAEGHVAYPREPSVRGSEGDGLGGCAQLVGGEMEPWRAPMQPIPQGLGRVGRRWRKLSDKSDGCAGPHRGGDQGLAGESAEHMRGGPGTEAAARQAQHAKGSAGGVGDGQDERRRGSAGIMDGQDQHCRGFGGISDGTGCHDRMVGRDGAQRSPIVSQWPARAGGEASVQRVDADEQQGRDGWPAHRNCRPTHAREGAQGGVVSAAGGGGGGVEDSSRGVIEPDMERAFGSQRRVRRGPVTEHGRHARPSISDDQWASPMSRPEDASSSMGRRSQASSQLGGPTTEWDAGHSGGMRPLSQWRGDGAGPAHEGGPEECHGPDPLVNERTPQRAGVQPGAGLVRTPSTGTGLPMAPPPARPGGTPASDEPRVTLDTPLRQRISLKRLRRRRTPGSAEDGAEDGTCAAFSTQSPGLLGTQRTAPEDGVERVHGARMRAVLDSPSPSPPLQNPLSTPGPGSGSAVKGGGAGVRAAAEHLSSDPSSASTSASTPVPLSRLRRRRRHHQVCDTPAHKEAMLGAAHAGREPGIAEESPEMVARRLSLHQAGMVREQPQLKRLKRAGESHKLGLRASPAATLPASARKPATKRARRLGGGRIPSGAGRAETGVHLFVDDIAEVSDSQDEEEDSQEEAECLALERRERRCSFLDDSTQPSLTGRGVDDESPLNEQAMYQRSLLESPSPWGRRAGGARRRHSKRGGQSKRGGGLSGSRDGYLRRTGRRFSLLSSASLASGKEDGSDAESSDGESSDGEHYDECGVCGKEGELLLCDNCPVAVHVWCVGLRQVPEGDWLCAQCSEARTTKEGLAQPAGVFSGQLGSRPGALVRDQWGVESTGHDLPRGNPRDDPRGNPRDNPRDDPRGNPRDDPRGNPRGNPRDNPRGEPSSSYRPPRFAHNHAAGQHRLQHSGGSGASRGAVHPSHGGSLMKAVRSPGQAAPPRSEVAATTGREAPPRSEVAATTGREAPPRSEVAATGGQEYDAMGSDIDWDNPEVDWEAIETASKAEVAAVGPRGCHMLNDGKTTGGAPSEQPRPIENDHAAPSDIHMCEYSHSQFEDGSDEDEMPHFDLGLL
ncbi:hypothetical protein CYMTET_31105 [Cymbomonas tetramitiformis]|uniref:Fanconi anemia group M protein n=1 Tax=Cymbomonas tetramitiformis TaxID=36881 RepID=A0AAE0FHW8_9CHLO|nr:hypothetical protein CYMTET_31105 [Cymbomonas tetramitiformis]